MRLAHFDCISGISGDMTLGALVSAGWPAVELQELPARLGLAGVTIDVAAVRRGPFAATKVDVHFEEKQPHRHLHHIEKILDGASIPAGVRDQAKAVFRRLAQAEADVHGSTVEKVHFHEVGAVDAIVDIVGSLLGFQVLGVTRFSSSPLPLGSGFVSSAHGRIPVPAPATAFLLRGMPVYGGPVEAELVTPTGAALLATLVTQWGVVPAHRLERVGTGAGTREFADHPNVMRLLIGETDEVGVGGQPVAVLETALDDENPQFVAALLPRLLSEGALDAMVVPATMKKGRSGAWLIVITRPQDAEKIARILLRETSTLGVRVRAEHRLELPRRLERVQTPFGPIEVKVASLPGGEERPMPEFESVRAAAEAAHRSLREVSEAAIAAWRQGHGSVPSTPEAG